MWAEHQTEPTGVEDLINYAFPVAPGVMLLKDGGLLTGFYYQGQDLDYSAPEEMERLSSHVNTAMMRCGTGWMVHVDLIRREAQGYMPEGAFTDPLLALLDEEARQQYNAKGKHYENVHTITFTYLPPPEIEEKISALFTEGTPDEMPGWETILESFTHTVNEIEGMLKAVLTLNRMDTTDLYTYLHMVVTGLDHPVRVPPIPVDADSIIANQDLVTGWSPEMGDLHVRVLSIDGYPQMTEPGAQSVLHHFPMEYRWSIRLILMSQRDATSFIETKRKHWFQRRHKFHQVIVSAQTREQSAFMDEHATDMAADASAAAAEAESGDVVYGLLTSTLIVSDENKATVNHKRKLLQEHIQQHGYGCRLERVNAVEALIGSWAGHGDQNLRRVPVHTLNWADMVPWTSIWVGLKTNPCRYFPPNSPPLMMATTTGQTPFYFNSHVGDVGHEKWLGPTRAGKSFGMELEFAQFDRYPNSQGFYLDKGYSSFVLAHAIGAPYYDIGNDETSFCPLAHVDDESEREWAKGWIESLLTVQGMTVTPGHNNAIWRALTLLGESPSRTLTDFRATVQDTEIRDALAHYCLGGGAGSLLDAKQDSLQENDYLFFEMETLLSRSEKDKIPVLLYIFHYIDKRCQTGRPTRVVIDEAWTVLASELFGEQLETWLRTLGKKNGGVTLATQSLKDIDESPYRSIVIDSCQTTIFVPNAAARASSEQYRRFGLNDIHIEMLTKLITQQEYLYAATVDKAERFRTINFQAGPVARATLGAGGREDIARAREMIAQHGDDWVFHWLVEHGCAEQAKWWGRWRERHSETEDERRQRYETEIFMRGRDSALVLHK